MIKKKIAKEYKLVRELHVGQTFKAYTAMVEYGKDVSYYNYKDMTNPTVRKVQNILAAGGTIVLVDSLDEDEGYFIKLSDLSVVKGMALLQLEYMLDRYNNLTDQYWLAIFDRLFKKNRIRAARYFASSHWDTWKKELTTTKFYVLDALAEPIIELEQDRSIQTMTLKEQKRMAALLTQAHQLGVWEALKEGKVYPNQEVTAPESDLIDVQVRYGEYGPYISKGTETTQTKADTMEAYLVNAYYFENGFRVESMDDKLEELAKLREWWTSYSTQARRTKVAKPQAKTIEKYERLEELEAEVGAILDQEVTNLAIMQ